MSALPIIALEEGHFAAEGLEMRVREYASGEFAMSAMLGEKEDVITCSEVPVVAAGFRSSDFAVIATVAASKRGHVLVARKSAGISSLADLRGKRVATLQNTAMHFLLHLMLLQQQMSEQDVVLSFLNSDDVVGPLRRGEVDALCIREPYTSQALEQVGDDVVVLEQTDIYTRTQHLVARKAFLRSRPEAARRLIRGLLRAERFALERPAKAQARVARRLNVEPSRLARDWAHLRLKVSLDQALLSQLEDEARWMLGAGLVRASAVPNYLELLDLQPLKAVQPEAITVIH